MFVVSSLRRLRNISCYLSRGVPAGGRSQEAPAASDLRAFFLDRSLNPLVPRAPAAHRRHARVRRAAAARATRRVDRRARRRARRRHSERRRWRPRVARTGRHSAAWLAHDALLAQTLGIFGADRYVPGPALSVSLSASGPPALPKPGSRRITVPPASSAAESVKVSSSATRDHASDQSSTATTACAAPIGSGAGAASRGAPSPSTPPSASSVASSPNESADGP